MQGAESQICHRLCNTRFFCALDSTEKTAGSNVLEDCIETAGRSNILVDSLEMEDGSKVQYILWRQQEL